MWATPEEESKEQAKPQMAQMHKIKTGDKSAAQQKDANNEDDREDEYGRELAQPEEKKKQ